MKHKIIVMLSFIFTFTIIYINSNQQFRHKFRCYVMNDYNDCLKATEIGENIKATDKLCTFGNEIACFNMGIYNQYKYNNLNKSIEYYKLSCDKNYNNACINLAKIYAENLDENKTAFDLLKKSCDNGSFLACENLGIYYITGVGTTKDINKSIRYFTFACENNMSISCIKLATLYSSNEFGMLDEKKAYSLYNKSCSLNNDNVLACSLKGFMLYRGLGVEENKELGLKILNSLCDKGIKESCQILEKIYK
ncbi:hypothetical protein CE91St25_17420 [Campylobacter ureolyticus]|uniref:tetratricopeptide repeat protein n=1 Tax=Campylobacter ureolyticus TaxID=827 RepID=UPI001FC86C72|nr:tetratricopeptide repeat protein [Campylobacter ureolyticus]GKH61406.1 hypothetical protein CE91St25_17420 [Campylobacter ureolyticus]